MTHRPLDVFLREHDNREHWDRGEDVHMEVDDDPTGWGALPWEPTDRDRQSNKDWDDLYGELRERYWEEVEYEDGYKQKKSRNN